MVSYMKLCPERCGSGGRDHLCQYRLCCLFCVILNSYFCGAGIEPMDFAPSHIPIPLQKSLI